MITEDYVSFEVAKLLKEKGFDWICGGYWYSKENNTEKGFAVSSLPANYNDDEYRRFDLPISAPTHQMARRWLREKHCIYADPIKQGNYNDCSEYWTWIVARMGIIHRNSTVVDKLSYEEAVEAALKYALENLI